MSRVVGIVAAVVGAFLLSSVAANAQLFIANEYNWSDTATTLHSGAGWTDIQNSISTLIVPAGNPVITWSAHILDGKGKA